MYIEIGRLRTIPDMKVEKKDRIDFGTIDLNRDQIAFKAPVEVNVTAENSNGILAVHGDIKADLQITCFRCLEVFDHSLTCTFEKEYRFSRDISAEETDAEVVPIQGDKIELFDVVLENILLELPMKLVCSEECRGLCEKCGVNLNLKDCDCIKEDIDPRLEVLKKYLKS